MQELQNRIEVYVANEQKSAVLLAKNTVEISSLLAKREEYIDTTSIKISELEQSINDLQSQMQDKDKEAQLQTEQLKDSHSKELNELQLQVEKIQGDNKSLCNTLHAAEAEIEKLKVTRILSTALLTYF